MKSIPYKFFWLSLIIIAIALFMPINGKAAGPSFDKLVHLLLFAFVSMNACFYFLPETKVSINNRRFLLVALFVNALPFTTEYIQSFIPGRHFENLDLVADWIGIGVGIIIFFVFKKLITKIYSTFGEHRPA